MINRLEIKNFQAHKHSVLEFVQGLNVISGTSDNGKSSIIRAIKWAAMNRPGGFSFHTYGAKDGTEVTLTVDDRQVVRYKAGKESYYEYEGIKYQALRTDVPAEVGAVMDIDAVSIQSQHDPYFLLQDSPGEVAKKLNALSGLSIMDDTLGNLSAEIRKTKTELGVVEGNAIKHAEDAAKFQYAEALEKEVESLRSAEEEFNARKKAEERLCYLLESMYKAVAFKQTQEKIIPLKTMVENIRAHRQNVTEKTETLTKLDTLIRSYYTQTASTESARAIASLREDVSTLKSEQKRLFDALLIESRLKRCLADKKRLDGVYGENQAILENGRRRLEVWKSEHPVCPTCGKEW